LDLTLPVVVVFSLLVTGVVTWMLWTTASAPSLAKTHAPLKASADKLSRESEGERPMPVKKASSSLEDVRRQDTASSPASSLPSTRLDVSQMQVRDEIRPPATPAPKSPPVSDKPPTLIAVSPAENEPRHPEEKRTVHPSAGESQAVSPSETLLPDQKKTPEVIVAEAEGPRIEPATGELPAKAPSPGETQVEIVAAQPPETAPPPVQAPPPSEEAMPVSVPPAPLPAVPVSPPSGVARAMPVNPDELTVERIAAYQVALERMHFSCGFVDGDVGMRTRRMLRSFQQSQGLPVTGELDSATRAVIGEPGEPFTTYTISVADMASIFPTPDTWVAKSKQTILGYNDPWEMLAEKFHCTRDYIRYLNRDVKEVAVGTVVIGPKVSPAAKIQKIAKVRIILDEATIQGLDASGRIVAHFPCSIARDKHKRPSGELTVKNVVPNPDYTFSPEVQVEAAAKEGITKKLRVPPGPNNPVGLAWVGLSLPGYGMHGTPDPEAISRTQSLGCFRLANWNAEKLLKMVSVGTPVTVVPPAEMASAPPPSQ
jgi:lipoprotein-anchoring transpeptidase ErfK/SrfK